MKRFGFDDRSVGGVELPQGTHQAAGPRRHIELQTIARGFVEPDLGGRAWKAAPTKTIARMQRAGIWEHRRGGSGQGRFPRSDGRRAWGGEERDLHQSQARDSPTRCGSNRERRRHFRRTTGQEKTRGQSACFSASKFLEERYGFFGLVAGAAVEVVVAGLVAGFSVVVVAG